MHCTHTYTHFFSSPPFRHTHLSSDVFSGSRSPARANTRDQSFGPEVESAFQIPDGLGFEFRGGAECGRLQRKSYHRKYTTSLCIHTPFTISATHTLQGIACNLDSDAFKKLEEATKEMMGECSRIGVELAVYRVEWKLSWATWG